MLGKIVVLGLIIAVVYMLYKKSTDKEASKPTPKKDGSDMIKCDKCGVYFEANEAIKKGGKNYCSNECAR